jgi:hypothetical protein
MNWNEYISITVLLSSAKINSRQIRNNQAAISLLAVVGGFFVAMINPAKKDWDIPMYNMGSILIIPGTGLLIMKIITQI